MKRLGVVGIVVEERDVVPEVQKVLSHKFLVILDFAKDFRLVQKASLSYEKQCKQNFSLNSRVIVLVLAIIFDVFSALLPPASGHSITHLPIHSITHSPNYPSGQGERRLEL